MDKEVVTELIQDELNETNLKRELDKILNDPAKKEQLKEDYNALRNLLQQQDNASATAAREIIGFLQSTS